MMRPFVAGVVVLVALLSLGAAAQTPPDLAQNWSDSDRSAWYDATQGSRLIPLAWLRALEQRRSTAPFLASDFIASFRYLPRAGGELPVGFAIDAADDEHLSNTRLRWRSGQSSAEQWVGFNCAACHTAEITFKGSRMRIEGGPTLADFQGFMEALNDALIATQDDPDKFGRFASRVLRTDDSDINRTSLKAALGQLISWQMKIEQMNKTDIRYGFGRLDAFGHIYNKVALVVDATSPTPNPANAPVSYPFLWNVPQQDWVQWNAMAPNDRLWSSPHSQPFDIGALGRNAGEVVGVFADVKPTAGAGLSGYVSSINVASLISMEQMLGRLRPPAWPAAMGVPDPDLVAKGSVLYAANCKSCHAVLDRTDLSTPIKVKVLPLKDDTLNATDPWMACNAYLDETQAGVLAGTKRAYVAGPPLAARAKLADMLAATVGGVLVGEKGEVVKGMALAFFGRQPPPVVNSELSSVEIQRDTVPAEALTEKERRLQRCMTEDSRTLGYKARPLNGIWATPPYLHNGSVPTLYDLLLPPEERPVIFWTGTREFDPDKVGFVTNEGPDNPFAFRIRDTSGRLIDGNSNQGHDYGNGRLSEDDRAALIAYLKTL